MEKILRPKERMISVWVGLNETDDEALARTLKEQNLSERNPRDIIIFIN
jgi:hypothetical protein